MSNHFECAEYSGAHVELRFFGFRFSAVFCRNLPIRQKQYSCAPSFFGISSPTRRSFFVICGFFCSIGRTGATGLAFFAERGIALCDFYIELKC